MSPRHNYEVTIEPGLEIAIDMQGLVEDDRPVVDPCIEIKLFDRIELCDGEPSKTLDHAVQVNIVRGSSRSLIYDSENPVGTEEADAFSVGLRKVSDYLDKQISLVWKSAGGLAGLSSDEAAEILELSRLATIVRSEGRRQLDRLKGKRQVRFLPLDRADQLLALSVVQEHFRDLAVGASILFRLREEIDKDGCRVAWSSGKDRKGREVRALGEAMKVSQEKGEQFRQSAGFAPDFVITFCAESWEQMDQEHRAFLVHHELCHCGIDAEKGTAYMAAHDLEEFGETLRAFGVKAAPGGRLAFLRAALEGMAEHGQLDLFDEILRKAGGEERRTA